MHDFIEDLRAKVLAEHRFPGISALFIERRSTVSTANCRKKSFMSWIRMSWALGSVGIDP
ncbi:MAG: hypothetical protein AAGI03_02910 [Pseudomonadota bacterium]